MLLRIQKPLAIYEIDRMLYEQDHGVFYTRDNIRIITNTIPESEWQKTISDMFVDGKLSYQKPVTIDYKNFRKVYSP